MHTFCLSIIQCLFIIFQIPGEVRFLGQSGGKLWPIPNQWNDLLAYKPDAVFWCLGGNSIDKDIAPADIIKEILSKVDELKKSGVRKVYVSEISERGDFRKSPGLTKDTFDNKRRVINRRLQKKLKDEYVTFPNIKYPADYNNDLVHFGEMYGANGLRKYFFSVRGILLSYRNVH